MPAEHHTTLTPDTPVRYLKGVGPKTAERFEKLGIDVYKRQPVYRQSAMWGVISTCMAQITSYSSSAAAAALPSSSVNSA